MNLKYMEITKELYDKLNELGMLPNEVRESNIGKSDYSKHIIQPWSIWKDYNLNPWDADIVKRVLRTKEESGMSEDEARIMDYEKIKHICDERIRQINLHHSEYVFNANSLKNYPISIQLPESHITYSVQSEQLEDFRLKHQNCKGTIQTCFSHESGVGVTTKLRCTGCGEEKDITDISKW